MKWLMSLSVFILMIGAAKVLAHGEDQSGPHGGEIRMPGAFHTEVLPVSRNKLKVYLLDINFANPTVLNSQVEATYSVDQKRLKINCAKEEDAFVCLFAKGFELDKKGSLELNAVYKNQKAGAVVYKTPLQIQKKSQPRDI